MAYPSNSTDAEWAIVEPLLTAGSQRGRHRRHSLRQVWNALRFQLNTGCQWRSLPRDFPPWWVVYQQFRRWADEGRLVQIEQALVGQVRLRTKRHEHPSLAILDSQTVKSTPESGQDAGFDGGKKGTRPQATSRRR